MASLINNVAFTPTAGSTTDWTYSAAVQGYNTPAQGGVVNSATYRYHAFSADHSQWEIGYGTYNTGTGVLARTTVLYNSSATGTASGQSGAGSKINFSVAPTVIIVALYEDLLTRDDNLSTVANASTARANLGLAIGTDVAPVASPTFTGTPAAPTASAGTSTTQIATTAFVTGAFRERLTAARTYYVRTDGSDSNTGLANTSGGAFLTIQKAVDTVASTLDIAGYTVTIQIADGTYTGLTALKNVVGFAAPGNLVIQGNSGTPANVLISVTSNHCFTADSTVACVWDIKDLKVTTTTSGYGFYITNGSSVRFGNINFGTVVNAHLRADNRSKFVCLSNYAISGAATYHWYVGSGCMVDTATYTITITGTPAFSSAFLLAGNQSYIVCYSMTFSGSATGARVQWSNQSNVFTNGAATTYLPGNSYTAPSGASYSIYS